MDYGEFIKNKKVIFVGACPNLKKMNLGKFIDNHDIVVRTNGSIELIKDSTFARDYGNRCDVLYINNQYYRNMRPLPVTQYMRQGIKWLCMKTITPNDRLKYQKRIKVRLIHNAMEAVTKNVYTATMGSFLMYDILQFEPAELFITGIDFFVSRKPEFEINNYKEYVKGYLPEKIVKEGNKINVGKTEDSHNFYDNAKFMYDLFQKYPNLKTNDFIYSLLENIIDKNILQGSVKWQ